LYVLSIWTIRSPSFVLRKFAEAFSASFLLRNATQAFPLEHLPSSSSAIFTHLIAPYGANVVYNSKSLHNVGKLFNLSRNSAATAKSSPEENERSEAASSAKNPA
jgi:hypothetical protein